MANSTPPNCGSHVSMSKDPAPELPRQHNSLRHGTRRIARLQTSEVHERSTTRRRNTCGWQALRPSMRISFGGAAAVAAGNDGGT